MSFFQRFRILYSLHAMIHAVFLLHPVKLVTGRPGPEGVAVIRLSN